MNVRVGSEAIRASSPRRGGLGIVWFRCYRSVCVTHQRMPDQGPGELTDWLPGHCEGTYRRL